MEATIKPRLGHISYINSLPIYQEILTKRVSFNGELISDHPAKLNEMIHKNLLDISPISVFEYALHKEQYRLLDHLCINSRGAVYSVLLGSHHPIEELNHKTIGLTMASATARNLLKIILKKFYGHDCQYVDIPIGSAHQNNHVDAELLIGDAAFVNRDKYPYCYDLAQEWTTLSKRPIVFAVWVVRKEFLEKHPIVVKEVRDTLWKSYQNQRKEEIIQVSMDLLHISKEQANLYFEALGYQFTDDMKDALLYYFEQANDLNLCPPCRALDMWDGNTYESKR